MSEEAIISTLTLQDPTLADLVEEFISTLPSFVSSLDQALQERDPEKAANIAHDIKGAGGSYGFQSVAQEAAQIEKLCKQGDLESAKRHFAQLRSLLPRLRAKP